MGKSIGIDLGTTNSVMCAMHTEAEILLNCEHEKLTPSTLAFRHSKKTGDAIMVGKLADNYAKMAGKNYLFSIKRLMGRHYDDPEVQKMIKRVSYDILPSPNGKDGTVRIAMGDNQYAPKEVASMVLKKLKEDAEMRLNDKVDSAVITVPAYFSERQKNATREAGILAGLKVKKIIDEPTAAAIAYGVGQNDDKDRTVLVFDLGGGTFDVSILLMLGGNFIQMNNEGDMWLGGDDFDRMIMDRVIKQVEAEEDMESLEQNAEFMHELKKKAREAKEILSTQMSAEILITDALKDDTGMPVPVEYEVTRNEFEKLVRPYVEKAIHLVKRSLSEAQLAKDEIDAVLLVGGSSTIPSFQIAMEDFFGKDKVLRGIDPMSCVAQGAGILAKSLRSVWCPCGHENSMSADQCEKCGKDLVIIKEESRNNEGESPEVIEELTQLTAKPYGIEVEGGTFVEIIPKNTVYPTEEPYLKEFKTVVPDQRIIKIPVREGFSSEAAENELMGNIWFYDLPPRLPEGTVIDISIALDKDMIFTLGCRIREIDWSRQTELQHDGWQNPALDNAMNGFIQITQNGLTGDHADEIARHVDGIQDAVENKDEDAARRHMERLDSIRKQQQEQESEEDDSDDWRETLENLITLGKPIFEKVQPVLPDDKNDINELEEWFSEAQDALDANNASRGRQLAEKGIHTLLNTTFVGDLVFATLNARRTDIDPGLSTRLEQAIQEVYSAIRSKDSNEFQEAYDAFKVVMKRLMNEMEEDSERSGPADIKVLLGNR